VFNERREGFALRAAEVEDGCTGDDVPLAEREGESRIVWYCGIDRASMSSKTSVTVLSKSQRSPCGKWPTLDGATVLPFIAAPRALVFRFKRFVILLETIGRDRIGWPRE
jgi:hypothetical protein